MNIINKIYNIFSIKKEPSSKSLPHDLDIKKLNGFIPPISSGRVIKVYDGDTITVASKVKGLKNSPIYKFSIRFNNIDTPELRTHNDEEKEIAIKARDSLSARIMSKDVFLKNIKTEKYGRLLCDVYLGDENLNDWMITQRYAIPYDGGTKTIPKSWKDYHDNNVI